MLQQLWVYILIAGPWEQLTTYNFLGWLLLKTQNTLKTARQHKTAADTRKQKLIDVIAARLSYDRYVHYLFAVQIS